MIRSLTFSLAAAVALAGAGLQIASSQADETTKSKTRSPEVHKTYKNRDAVEASRLDTKTKGHHIRASQLMGMNIQNREGKSLGEIQDLVVDSKSGKIEYAAVTYGGFLGLGDKLFAVPFEAFKCQQDPDDKDDYYLLLNVTQEQLEGAKGFDQDNWPSFANPEFTRELDTRYKIDRKKMHGNDHAKRSASNNNSTTPNSSLRNQ